MLDAEELQTTRTVFVGAFEGDPQLLIAERRSVQAEFETACVGKGQVDFGQNFWPFLVLLANNSRAGF